MKQYSSSTNSLSFRHNPECKHLYCVVSDHMTCERSLINDSSIICQTHTVHTFLATVITVNRLFASNPVARYPFCVPLCFVCWMLFVWSARIENKTTWNDKNFWIPFGKAFDREREREREREFVYEYVSVRKICWLPLHWLHKTHRVCGLAFNMPLQFFFWWNVHHSKMLHCFSSAKRVCCAQSKLYIYLILE